MTVNPVTSCLSLTSWSASLLWEQYIHWFDSRPLTHLGFMRLHCHSRFKALDNYVLNAGYTLIWVDTTWGYLPLSVEASVPITPKCLCLLDVCNGRCWKWMQQLNTADARKTVQVSKNIITWRLIKLNEKHLKERAYSKTHWNRWSAFFCLLVCMFILINCP